jgi:4'-phosphopantetheinyl transferase
LIPGELHVWIVDLERPAALPPTAGETARAARFLVSWKQTEYLRSHAALRAILGTSMFGVTATGKPYVPASPSIQFNLSHSGARALVAVALDVEVGADVERIRPMPEWREIAERFFPPSEAAALEGESDFFHRWTRIEAVLKARGVGLYGAGEEPEGEWTLETIDVGPEYSAAVAARREKMKLIVHEFGAEE